MSSTWPMRKTPQRDNTTYERKVSLRCIGLHALSVPPVVLETHGGAGAVWRACYRSAAQGVVFEKDPDKAELLARQRPTWSVYEADCVPALRAGVGAHLPVNVLDVDPYGPLRDTDIARLWGHLVPGRAGPVRMWLSEE